MRFMVGMVSEPVITVLAMEEPEIMPISPEASTDTLAGPPANRPATQWAMSMNNCPRPTRMATMPNSTKWKT